jgi:hypothetical protein
MRIAAGRLARSPRVQLVATLVLLAVVAGAALRVDRSSAPLPPCTFHVLTGFHCPGCGSTRAMRALLHADVIGAMRFNTMTVLFVPVIAWAYARWAIAAARRRPSLHLGALLRPRWILSLAVMLCVYWVARNIPHYPFSLLAPGA